MTSQVNDLTAALNRAIVETNDVPVGGWVICRLDDYTPIRTDGKTLAMYGTSIYNSTDHMGVSAAARTLNGLARKMNGKHAVTFCVMRTEAWARQRVMVLRDLITHLPA